MFGKDVDSKLLVSSRKVTSSAKAMKLGSKSRDVESFVDQLKSEGENVVTPAVNKTALVNPKVPAPSLVHTDE